MSSPRSTSVRHSWARICPQWHCARGAYKWQTCLTAAVAALALLLTAQVSDAAPPRARGNVQTLSLDEVERVWPRLSAEQKFIVIDQLLKGGRFDTARRLLDSSHFPPSVEATRRFYVAMVLKAEGQHDEAIDIFRDILASHPEFDRVRLELAHSLYQLQEDESARHHFELILGGSGTQPGLADTVKSYINAIDGRRRWDFSAYFSIAPSTNLNQGSDNRVVYLNGQPFVLDNVKESGVGIVTGFQGGYRLPVTDKVDLVASAGVHTKRYEEEIYSDLLASASFGPRYRYSRGYVGVYGLYSQRWYADENYSASWGILVSASTRLGPADVVFADITCSERRFEDNWRGSDLTYQDGHVCGVSGRYEHYFDSATYVRVLGGGGQERTGLEHLDNDRWYVGAGVYRELPWGVSVYAQGLYTRRDYDGIYPGATFARLDDRYDVSVNVTKRDWEVWGFAPMLQYTFTMNESNISFQEFNAHGANLTFTKRY